MRRCCCTSNNVARGDRGARIKDKIKGRAAVRKVREGEIGSERDHHGWRAEESADNGNGGLDLGEIDINFDEGFEICVGKVGERGGGVLRDGIREGRAISKNAKNGGDEERGGRKR